MSFVTSCTRPACVFMLLYTLRSYRSSKYCPFSKTCSLCLALCLLSPLAYVQHRFLCCRCFTPYDLTPPDMRHIIVKAETKHGLRNGNKAVVPRFNTNFMKHSIAHRGSVIWNALSQHLNVKTSNFKSFFNIVRGKNILKDISFEALSL